MRAYSRPKDCHRRLQQSIGQFFHQHLAEEQIYIEHVEMPNRKTAIVYFTLGHSLVLDTETIELVYKKILDRNLKLRNILL